MQVLTPRRENATVVRSLSAAGDLLNAWCSPGCHAQSRGVCSGCRARGADSSR
jgi:hypothetical protein